jgi:hypothetical protein
MDTEKSTETKPRQKPLQNPFLQKEEMKIIQSLIPNGRYELLRGIKNILANSRFSDRQSDLYPSDNEHRQTLVLLRNSANDAPALWEVRYKNSRIWISRYAYLFSNDQLGQADNAVLISNIITSCLIDQGRVIFDDMHHGYSALYDPQAFFKDKRVHNTLWFIFAFWLLYVVGHSNRLAPLAKESKLPRAVDYIHAMANLFARRLDNTAAARLLFNHFFDSLRLQYNLPSNGQPTWNLLESSSRITAKDLVLLKNYYIQLERRKNRDLVILVNLMQKIRNGLA